MARSARRYYRSTAAAARQDGAGCDCIRTRPSQDDNPALSDRSADIRPTTLTGRSAEFPVSDSKVTDVADHRVIYFGDESPSVRTAERRDDAKADRAPRAARSESITTGSASSGRSTTTIRTSSSGAFWAEPALLKRCILRPSGRLMRILGPIVLPSPAIMQVVDAEIEGCCAVGPQIIRDQSIRNDGVFPQKFAHEFQRGVLVALGLDQHIQKPRPRRRRRATGKPCAHRFSDRPRQDARSNAVWDGACAIPLQ